MNKLNKKIIYNLQSKHDSFLGVDGEQLRQSFKDGLLWAIDTIETMTDIYENENKNLL